MAKIGGGGRSFFPPYSQYLLPTKSLPPYLSSRQKFATRIFLPAKSNSPSYRAYSSTTLSHPSPSPRTMTMAPRRAGLQLLRIIVLVAVLLSVIGHHLILISPFSDPDQAAAQINQKNVVGTGASYQWPTWHNERTIAVTTLGETKFARCDVHTVSTVLVLMLPSIRQSHLNNLFVYFLDDHRY